MTDTATAPKKALSRQDQRNLEKLIDSDFRDATNSLRSAADAHVRAATAQLESEHVELEAGAADIAAEIAEFEKSMREQWRAKISEVKERGYEILDGYGNAGSVGQINLSQRVQPAGKAVALRKIVEDARYAETEAHRELDRARNQALRGVFVAGISGQTGLDLLKVMPTAADAFAAALPKPEPKAVEG